MQPTHFSNIFLERCVFVCFICVIYIDNDMYTWCGYVTGTYWFSKIFKWKMFYEATTTMHVIHFFILFFIGKIKRIVNHGPGQDLWLGDLPAELLFHIAQLSAFARSSRPEVFSSKDDLENFAKFTGAFLWICCYRTPPRHCFCYLVNLHFLPICNIQVYPIKIYQDLLHSTQIVPRQFYHERS